MRHSTSTSNRPISWLCTCYSKGRRRRGCFLKQLHWIVTPDPASEKDVARLIDAVASSSDAKPGQLWRYTSPYRGLSAMEEKDSDYFLGASARPSKC